MEKLGLKYWVLWLFLGLSCISKGQEMGNAPVFTKRPYALVQDFRNPDQPLQSFFRHDTVFNKKRNRTITGVTSAGYGLFSLYLGTSWYAKQDMGWFHFFNDGHEWLQLDKAGHTLGGYWGSKWMIDLYKWSGKSKQKAILQGGTIGFLAMSSIEIFDGFGKTYGASWKDIVANGFGSGLAMANQALWNEYRIQRKYSYFPSIYTRSDSVAKYGYVLGTNLPEWILKDYNGQVHWLSFRVHSFLPEGSLKDHYPRWLNLAVGYGGTGMIGSYDDPIAQIRTREMRRYYLSFDIDVSNIRTRSAVLNSFFQMVNIFRIPLPVLEMDRLGSRINIK